MEFRRLSFAVIVVAALFVAGCTSYRDDGPDVRVVEHKVASGETLEELSERYYGHPDGEKRIRRFNEMNPRSQPDSASVVRVPLQPENYTRLRGRERARVLNNEGIAQVDRGAYLDAVSSFDEAIKLYPDFADAHYHLGVTLQRMKSYDRAVQELERAATLQRDNVEYRYALGNAHYYREAYPAAVRAFRKTLDLAPRHRKAQYSLASALEKMGEVSSAISAWQRYLEIDPDSEWATRARQRLDALAQK